MAYPTDKVVTGDLITAAQINRWCAQLANETLTGTDADFDFTSIPAHWSHLLLIVYGRGDQVAASSSLRMEFNGDTGANYDSQDFAASAAAVTASETFGGTSMIIASIPAASAGANLFGDCHIWIPHYAGSANNKVAETSYAYRTGTASGNMQRGGEGCFWRSNAAINRVRVFLGSGSFVAGSRATLYGKGTI